MGTLLRRLKYWVRRDRLDAELAEEIEFHRALRQARLEESGLPPHEAAQASRRALGSLTAAREEVREVWIWRWADELLRDLRHGARLLRRSPGFTLVAVLSLGLGIGANTAIFSLVDAVILKMLPVEAPERLVVLDRMNMRGERYNFSYPLFDALRMPDRTFSGMFAAIDGTYHLEMSGPGSTVEAEPVLVQAVSGEYFQVLGVRAAAGRLLTVEDDRSVSTEPVAVVSYAVWQQRFLGDRAVIGRRIVVKRQTITVIGVAPPRFSGESVGRAPDLWVPLTIQPKLDPPMLLDQPNVGWLRVMARLRPGVSLEQAQDVVDRRLQALKKDTGDSTDFGRRLRDMRTIAVSSGSQGLSDTQKRFSRQLWMLMAVVGIVLLIACTNVANLLLVRAEARARETAIRLAIGAGRGRLVRQFLTESVILSLIGGTVGLLLGWWGSRLLVVLASGGATPLSIDVTPDARVLAFTAGVSALTVLLFGLAPADLATRRDVSASFNSIGAGRGRPGLPRLLVIAQVGLSLLLVTGAGLFLQTLRNLRAVDLGFEAGEIVQAGINPQRAGYTRDQLPDLYRRLLERLRSAPGIRSVSLATNGFRTGSSRTCCVAVQGHVPGPGEEREMHTISITPDYFQTMGLRMLHGRAFTWADVGSDSRSPKVAIVNEAMARAYFDSEAPIGRRFGWGDPPNVKYDTEVVGIVRNARYGDLRERVRPVIYFPASGGRYVVLRGTGTTATVAGILRGEVQAVDRNLDELDIRTVPQLMDEALVLERLLAKLSGLFGAIALLLVSIGLYGLMAYAVARRTKEIGIRVALGAQRTAVVGLVFTETLRLVFIGLALGVCAALITTRLATSMLFGVTPMDPMTIGVAMLLLLVMAALASALPARRAARVEPMVALRHE